MWIDDRGVVHTVALPDPTGLMTPEFRRGFDAMALSHRQELQRVIDAADEEISEADLIASADEDQYVACSPPLEILRGDVRRPDDVRLSIQQVSERWRLDVVLALDDYLD